MRNRIWNMIIENIDEIAILFAMIYTNANLINNLNYLH